MSLRTTLRKRAKGKLVIELQKLLNKALAPSKVLADGDFGEQTRKAVIEFQKKANLTADGIVGKATWSALANIAIDIIKKPVKMNTLADIASKYLGVKETGNNRAGTSKEMLEIFEADDLIINKRTDGYPWCAAFVSLCVQKLCKPSALYGALIPPREPSVNRFLNVWAKQHNCLVFKPDSKLYQAVEGDIIVFTFSHIGIVESNNGSFITTIEGNTNEAGSREGITVARKKRTPSIVRAIIRLPMTTISIEKRLKDSIQYC